MSRGKEKQKIIIGMRKGSDFLKKSGIILSLTVSKVKMPFEPSVLQALRAFLFRFETKKIVFYFPLLCFCIVLI